MLFRNIDILNEDFSVSHGMDVAIEGAYITSIRPSSEIKDNIDGRVIDGKGKLLMPGFYNSHTHAPMTLLRGWGENMPLNDWLHKKVFPFENKLIGDDCYHATKLSLAESFANGIVSMSDMYFFCDDIVRAVVESGAKINASRGIACLDKIIDFEELQAFQESKNLFRDYHDTHDGRIRVTMSMHAEYTSTPALIEAVAGLSSECGAPVHVHVSETLEEHEECKTRNEGRTPTRVLSDGGLFENGGLAAHCVWIEDEDADILLEKGVTICTCPVSNMKLASGVARVPLLLEKGLNIALGTDGTASNNNLNFFEEIKLLALSAKVHFNDPTLITPEQALFAATRAGALAQGRLDCGFVKEGFRADLIMLDMNSPALTPVYEIANSLVYSASNRDIKMTLIDGMVVYEDGEIPTIDVERTIFECNKAKTRVLEELTAGKE